MNRTITSFAKIIHILTYDPINNPDRTVHMIQRIHTFCLNSFRRHHKTK